MARINVEQKAMTDPRFYRLGLELGAPPEWAQAAGLFMGIRVWNECIEKGKYILDGWLLQAIVGKTDGAEIILRADLAVALSGNRFRIRGTKGRVEYLEQKRKLAQKNGQKGGRPRKPTSVSKKTDVGCPQETPPAPAPAPAPVLSSEKGGTPPGNELLKPEIPSEGVAWLVAEFFHAPYRGPRMDPHRLHAEVTAAMQECLDHGLTPEAIIAEIKRPDRDRTEFVQQLTRRLLRAKEPSRGNHARKPTLEERIAASQRTEPA